MQYYKQLFHVTHAELTNDGDLKRTKNGWKWPARSSVRKDGAETLPIESSWLVGDDWCVGLCWNVVLLGDQSVPKSNWNDSVGFVKIRL